MYREQYERKCPTCGEWISATAPKCFNCGERVDQDDDEESSDEGRGNPRATVGWVVGIGGALIGIGVLVWLFRGALPGDDRAPGPRDETEATAEQLHRMLGQRMGRESLNDSSPMTWAEVEPQLRKGMPFDELTRIVAAKDTPRSRTTFGNAPAEGEEADGMSLIIYLLDVTLTVRLDGDQRVISWTSKAAR